MNPAPSQAVLDQFYSGPYWANENKKQSRAWFLRKQLRRAINWDRMLHDYKVGPGAKILEIGSGFGGVLYGLGHLMQANTVGLEVDESARRFQASLGLSTLDAYSDDVEALRGQFDFVLLSHVLEHMLDPSVFLEYATQFVRPGGLLLVEVPYGTFVVDGGLNHLTSFSRTAFRGLLSKFGTVLQIHTHSGPTKTFLPPMYLSGLLRVHSESKAFDKVGSTNRLLWRWIAPLIQMTSEKLRGSSWLRRLDSAISKNEARETTELTEQLLATFPAHVFEELRSESE